MIKVNLQEIAPTNGYNQIIFMRAVPRVGDSIAIDMDSGALEVRAVIWTPFNPDYEVQVRFR